MACQRADKCHPRKDHKDCCRLCEQCSRRCSIDFANIESITFTSRGDGNKFIDELRIGSTYAAVIPERA